MNRSEFIIATAIILFVAFAMGWFANSNFRYLLNYQKFFGDKLFS